MSIGSTCDATSLGASRADDADATSVREWTWSTAASNSPTTLRSMSCRFCESALPLPPSAPASGPPHWPDCIRRAILRSPGRPKRVSFSWRYSPAATMPYRLSRRSISQICGAVCCPNGNPIGVVRNATRITASRSIATCSKRSHAPPISAVASNDPTCCCSARCYTTLARATPATTPWWA